MSAQREPLPRLFRRRRKAHAPDRLALLREAGYLRDRAHSISREAGIAAVACDLRRLGELDAEQTAVVERLQTIAREMGVKSAAA